MNHLLRSLIRETLLLEEVYGAQAVVYHGTGANPQALIDALLQDKFTPGAGAGAMYGKGLYTVYDLKGTQTESGSYGSHIIKLKVNLYGYIIFDPDVALKVYKKQLTPAEQAQEVGYNEDVIKTLRSVKVPTGRFTSDSALKVHDSLQYEVKGIVFTGRNDGRVAVVYDPTTAVPMAWKQVDSKSWTPVDRTALLAPLDRPDVSDREGRPVKQSALRRSAMGDFEAGKWSLLMNIKRLERLPEDQRIVKGDLNLSNTPITSLPSGLKVDGDLFLNGSKSLIELPSGLKVDGSLDLSDTGITSLSADLKVGGSLYLNRTGITSLPAGLKVGGSLDLSDTGITSLPAGLHVKGSLNLDHTDITSLPAGLKVDGDLYLNDTKSLIELPSGLEVGGDLKLNDTGITSLPADLSVGGNLDLINIGITSLPAGLKVGGSLYLNSTDITTLPAGLHVNGSLFLSDNKSLIELPSGLRVGGSLNLNGTGITSLPEDLHVNGSLNLRNAKSLIELPSGLRVGGSLDLSGTDITSLPADLKVGGYIWGFDRKYWPGVPQHLKDKLR